MAYKVSIKEREREAKIYENLIREAFDFKAAIFTAATVEGQPNPDKDMWTVRAEVVPGTFLVFQIGPHRPEGQAVLAYISVKGKGVMGEGLTTTTLREAHVEYDEAVAWISLAWLELNPDEAKQQMDKRRATLKAFSGF